MLSLVKTADGSFSIRNSELNETYHSIHGAEQESNHVFIQEGLIPKFELADSIKILEVGFGTGLNALLSYEYVSNKAGKQIDYHCLEPFPIGEQLVDEYSQHLVGERKELFIKLHQSTEKDRHLFMQSFAFTKQHQSLANYHVNEFFDLIYYDAFGPNAQPEMWTKEMLAYCSNALLPNGVWVSYCSKGQVRRNLQSLGFHVERIPGPPGKREMLRATKKE